MDMPKEITTYCPVCNSHQKHKIKLYTVVAMQNARTTSQGQRRHHRKHVMGYGGKAKHVKTPKKQNRTPVFLAECQNPNCKNKKGKKAKHYFSLGKRMKKVNQQ